MAYGKMTVLRMVQDILSAMDSDQVNSIGDTIESMQVADALETTYYEVTSGLTIPSFQRLVRLDALTDTAKPNYLSIPDNVKDILWIKYDARTNGQTDYREVYFLEPNLFLFELEKRNNLSKSSIEVEDFSGARLRILNQQAPYYWTTFDNNYVVFDAWNSTIETTVEQTNNICMGEMIPEFYKLDSFVPELDADQFPLLLAECKSYCFANFKQMSNPKEEQKAKRQRVRSMNDLWRLNQRRPYERLPNYGRKPGQSSLPSNGFTTYRDLP